MTGTQQPDISQTTALPEWPNVRENAGLITAKIHKLIYKGQWHHCNVLLVPRFYPSSKTCSTCGYVNAKLKRERYWQCPSCTTIHERNENAAASLQGLLARPGHTGSALLRDGTALAIGLPNGETSPDDRRTVPPESETPAPLTVSR